MSRWVFALRNKIQVDNQVGLKSRRVLIFYGYIFRVDAKSVQAIFQWTAPYFTNPPCRKAEHTHYGNISFVLCPKLDILIRQASFYLLFILFYSESVYKNQLNWKQIKVTWAQWNKRVFCRSKSAWKSVWILWNAHTQEQTAVLKARK